MLRQASAMFITCVPVGKARNGALSPCWFCKNLGKDVENPAIKRLSKDATKEINTQIGFFKRTQVGSERSRKDRGFLLWTSSLRSRPCRLALFFLLFWLQQHLEKGIVKYMLLIASYSIIKCMSFGIVNPVLWHM